MTNPFDWKNNPSRISMKDVDYANRKASRQSAALSRKRAEGIEPSIVLPNNSRHMPASHFASRVPDMPYSKWTKEK